jgi:hypothetical protein
MTTNVQDLARQVWDARERNELRWDSARMISRATALAMAADVRECEVYDPETDIRVRWLREMSADLRGGAKWRRPRASTEAEYGVMFVLGRLEEPEMGGKDRACGAV